VQDEPNSNPRAAALDQTVERLTSEVSALKLELATLHSALRELQFQQTGHRGSLKQPPPEPPVRPTLAPAAIVVLLAAGLLTWQLISTPQAERTSPPRPMQTAVQPRQGQPARTDAHLAITTASPTEPPVTPLVKPTIYRGTLAVNADRPGAIVFVNRKNVGKAPVRVRNLKAGAHLVWVEHEGYRRWTRVVTVPAERVTRVSADLQPTTDDR
jgi:hypothetical protein